MYIESISLQNYKSFKNYTKIHLTSVNWILGTNGSGKSNFISAILSAFMHDSVANEKNVSYNKNEDVSTIEIEINNDDLFFPNLEKHIYLKKTFLHGNITYTLNEKAITSSELRGIFEYLGFYQYNFIAQNFSYNINILQILHQVSGITKFNEVEEYILKNLNNSELDTVMEKLEYKSCKYNEINKKLDLFQSLNNKKKMLEYKIACIELENINAELKNISLTTTKSDDEILEIKLEDTRNEILEKIKEKNHIAINEELVVDNKKIQKIIDKIAILEKSKIGLYETIEKLKKESLNKEIIIQAIKYFEVMNTKEEDLPILEKKHYDLKQQFSTIPLIRNRKELFINKNQLENELLLLQKKEMSFTNKLICINNLQINLYEMVRNEFGVAGIIYNMININVKWIKALAAVAKSSLFYIVVDNQDIGDKCIHLISDKGKGTFLNYKLLQNTIEERISGISLLSDFITVKDEKYVKLINFISKKFFVTTDLQKALSIRNKYKVNVVTVDGDIVSANGSITGGYDKSDEFISEVFSIKTKIHEINNELSDLDKQIKDSEILFELENDINKKAYLKCLEYKIDFYKSRSITIPHINDEIKAKNKLDIDIHNIKVQLSSINTEISQIKSKNKAELQEYDNRLKIKQIDQEIISLKNTETNIINELYNLTEDNQNTNVALAKKNILLDKRAKLMKEYNITHLNSVQEDITCLYNELKQVKQELKPYSALNLEGRNIDKVINMKELQNTLNTIKHDTQKILDYVNYISERKSKQILQTQELITSELTRIYHVITGNIIEIKWNETVYDSTKENRNNIMCKVDDIMNIKINNEEYCFKSLSGGQKTLFIICFILSIHKIYPLPIYIFDEIDANLDVVHTSKIYNLLLQLNSQFIITTFKNIEPFKTPNTSYFKVSMNDKKSTIQNSN